MEVLKLMNSNSNWKEILSFEPYNISIKEEDGFVLLKYSQLSSDFSLPIVRECRGAIFTQQNGRWICVRRAFDKFGNYNEGYVAQIDWDTAVVQEKIDGSLMSVWFHEGVWHLSTNGTINAFNAPLNGSGLTFGQYFCEALGVSWEKFTNELNPFYCYTFELVGPLNRIVVPYERSKLYAIGQRDMRTMEEVQYSGPFGDCFNIQKPKFFRLFSLGEVVDVAARLSKDEEGFVVCDANFNRIKVKSLEYLTASRLRNNGVVTKKRVLEMLLDETIDDFLSYCPQYEAYTERIKNEFVCLLKQMEQEATFFGKKIKLLSNKECWLYLCKNNIVYKDYLVALRKDELLTPLEYVRLQIEKRGIGWLDSKILCTDE